MPCSTSVTTMALKSFDSCALGARPLSSRNAMSPRLKWPRICRGRSMPRTTIRSALDQPISVRMVFRRALSIVGLHAGGPDDLAPACNLLVHELRQLLRRRAGADDSGLLEAL